MGRQSSVFRQSKGKNNDNAGRLSTARKRGENPENLREKKKGRRLRCAGFWVEGGAAAGGGEGFAVGAEFGLLEEIAGSVKGEMAVSEFDAEAGVAGDVHIVRDHEDGVAGLVELAKDVDDDVFIGFVEITSGFIRED